MRDVYTVRFWNEADECIIFDGHSQFIAYSFDDAFNLAYALLGMAVAHGAVEMDINNSFYPIIDD